MNMNETNSHESNLAEASAVRLSRRLQTLAGWVPEGARFADIGTDHALLPVYLAGSGRIRYAVAGDVNPGPVEAARRQVAEANLSDRVSVRHGDGFTVIAAGEVDTACLAGMGGSLMVRLLEAAGERLDGVTTLVLSPHVAEDAVRRWLVRNRFVLDREQLLEEDGIVYTLLRAVREFDDAEADRKNRLLYDEEALAPCAAKISVALLLEMGPYLIRQGGSLFRGKWEQEAAKRLQVIDQMKRSSAVDASDKIRQWEQAVAEIKEVLACLPEEKR